MTTTTAISAIQAIETELNDYFLDRKDVIRGLLLALISRQHLLMVGEPGTAKSAIARALANHLTGGRYFETLLTKFTPPEDVFGPIAISKLMQDVQERKTAGYAPDAELVMIDEVGKASNAILNSFLTLMNERVFHNGGIAQTCPLMTMVGASNELPDGDELSALYDRFLLRFQVGYLDDAEFEALLDSEESYRPQTFLTLSDLTVLQDQVAGVALPVTVRQAMVKLRSELRDGGFQASDRRWKASRKLMAANALLNGRNIINEEDLEVLANSLWRKPSERTTIFQKVVAVANPLKAEITALLDTYHTIRQNVEAVIKQTGESSAATGEARLEAQNKMKELGQQLEKLANIHANTTHAAMIEDARRQASNLHKGFLLAHMGMRL
jgi:MoxR-like ATPase